MPFVISPSPLHRFCHLSSIIYYFSVIHFSSRCCSLLMPRSFLLHLSAISAPGVVISPSPHFHLRQISHYFVMAVLAFRYLFVATHLITSVRHCSIASLLLSLQRLRPFCQFPITRLPSSPLADHHLASSSVALLSLPSRVARRHHPKIIFLITSFLSL